MSDVTPTSDEARHRGQHASATWSSKLLLVIAAAIGCLVFDQVGKVAQWPLKPHYQASLVFPISGMAILAAMLATIASGIIGHLILGKRFWLAGVLAASVGMTIWSVRGGGISPLLLEATQSGVGPKIFIHLALELLLLFVPIALLWNWLWIGTHSKLPAPNATNSQDTVSVVLIQSAIMMVLAMLMLATPVKKQAWLGLFVAGFLAVGAVDTQFASRGASRWYWVAPLLVGCLGYLLSYLYPQGMETGDLIGAMGSLGRAVPLDYASAGVAGTVFGYWWFINPAADTNPAEKISRG